MSARLDWLRTFTAVYRLGSFTKAAQRLELSQPAVTQQVRNLERELGRPLFDRTPQGVRPTAAAEGLIREIDGPMAELDGVIERAFGRRDPDRPLHVGGPAEFVAHRVLPAIGDLVAGGMRLRFDFGLADDLLARLAGGEFDLVLSTVRPRMRGITATALADEEFALVASAEVAARIPAGALARTGPAALEGLPLFAYAESLPIVRRYWRDVFGTVPSGPPSLVVPDLRAVLAAVGSSAGVSVLPTYLCERDLAAGRIAVLLEPEVPPINTLFLAVRRGEPSRPDLAALRTRLVERARGGHPAASPGLN